jgi:hypothetical protein
VPPEADVTASGAESSGRPRRRLFRKRTREETDDVRPATQSEAKAADDGTSEQSPEELEDAQPEAEADDSTPEPTLEELEAAQPGPFKPVKAPSRNRIKRDRQRLDSERQAAQFDLGGLALELFRRDAITEPLLRVKAAQLIDLDEQVQLLDWRLEAIETERRQRKGMEPPVAGACLSCGAEFAPAAAFCWRCGVRFAPETRDQSALTAEIGTIQE